MAPPRYTRRPAGARGPRQADARSGGVFLPPRLDDRPGKAPRSSALAARGADIGRAGRDRALVSCPFAAIGEPKCRRICAADADSTKIYKDRSGGRRVGKEVGRSWIVQWWLKN